MSKIPPPPAGASLPAPASPPPPPAGGARTPPAELTLALNAFVRVSSARWLARRIVFYADAAANRFRVTLYLERAPDQLGDPLDPRPPRPTAELAGEGRTLAEAVAGVYAQLAPPAPILWPEPAE